MLNIGIECESIEGYENWGIGRIVKKFLEEMSNRPELADEFRFFLYFKSHIPADLPYLDNPIFVKKALGVPSFSLYYYLLLPIKLWFEKLDMMFFPNYMLPIIFHGKSLVILTEDIYYEVHSGTLPWQYKLAYKIFAGWWAARHATKIMAISETSKKEVAKLLKINPDHIFVNTLGIDSPKNITTNYQLPTTNYVLYVGQAFPRRHLKETMFAFEKLISSRTERLNLVEAQPLNNLKLIAIGRDKYNPPIIGNLVEKINGRLDRDVIIWKEYAPEDELHQLYIHAKLLVYVSSKEAFGLPPLEALSYGVPAVVADQSITREIFGDNAFFVANPDDLNSIAAAITEGLTNGPKYQEIKNARRDVLEKYTWQKFVDKFLQFAKNI